MRLAAAVLAGLVLAAPAVAGPVAVVPAAAGPVVAVPGLDFTDTMGNSRDPSPEHLARLALFVETLRTRLSEGGVGVVVPDCGCTPLSTPFKAMAAATREAGAHLLLVGGIHAISKAIGSGKLTLIDLDGGKVVCDRAFTYRGDTDEAWRHAAEFAARDVLQACFPAAAK